MDPTELRKVPKILKKIKKRTFSDFRCTNALMSPSYPDQNKLNQVCKYFLSTIIKNLAMMPFGMRWLSKLLARYDTPPSVE